MYRTAEFGPPKQKKNPRQSLFAETARRPARGDRRNGNERQEAERREDRDRVAGRRRGGAFRRLAIEPPTGHGADRECRRDQQRERNQSSRREKADEQSHAQVHN